MSDSPTPPRASSAMSIAAPGAHLADYWRVVVLRRNVVITCLSAVVALTALYSFLATPQYKATTTLQISRLGPDVLTFKDVVGVDPMGYLDFYQTQFKIVQSRSVLRLAAERLDLLNRPELTTRKASPLGAVLKWILSAVASRGSGPKEAADPLAPAVDFLSAGLSVEPIRNSQLLRVSFTDRDAKLAAEIANAVAEAYQTFNLQSRTSTTAQAADFLTKEVARVQGEIAAAERDLQEYGNSKELVEVGQGFRDISQQALADLNAKLTEARGRFAIAEARWRSVQKASPDSLPEVLNSPLISRLKEEHAAVERRYSQMAERFKSDWPPLQQVQEELAQAIERLNIETETIASRVREVARADYDRARVEVESLSQQVDRQRGEVMRVSRDNITYASLKAEIETKRKVLSDLVTRQSQTETSERLRDTQTSNVRVVDAADVPKSPVSPRKAFNLMLSLVLGLALGVVLALLVDQLDATVKDEQDLQRVASVAVLGHVPLYQPLRAVGADAGAGAPFDPVDAASHLDPRSPFAEAFRTLRTSFLLASPERPPRTVVVTSFEPSDGKSTVCMNLAIVLTQLDRRVLLVDADQRRPRLHKMLRLPNTVGLSTVLSGNARLEDALQETAMPHLWAVTSGPIPPNPAELLGSTALDQFLVDIQAADRFDHILIDSPPSLQVADGIILASKTDATIVVVRVAKTERTAIQHGVQRVRVSRGHIVGAVLNAATEGRGYYYYAYKHGDYRDRDEQGSDAGAAATRPRRASLGGRRSRRA